MITVRNLYKRYRTAHGAGPWVLNDISFTIPTGLSVGVVGKNGAGKSTLLRLLAGVDRPTKGSVEREGRISWPLGFGGGLQGVLTGRQNAKFVCRIHGHEEDIPARLERIEAFAELGRAFDEPIRTYSTGMAARLRFAMSVAFDFDVYISDEITATGDAAFRKKAGDAFAEQAKRSSLIMVSHQEKVLLDYCSAGIWIRNGQCFWYDTIDEAVRRYRKYMTA